MYDIEPVSVNDHWRSFKDVQIPLVVVNSTTVVGFTTVIVLAESFHGAENAAQEDERRCAIEHDEDGAHIGCKHVRALAADVQLGDQANEETLNYPLQDKRNGDELSSVDIARGSWFILGYPPYTDRGKSFDRDTDVDEKIDDATRMEGGVHREIVHQSCKNVVLYGGIDRRTGEDEYCLSDVEVQIRQVAG